MSVSKEEIKEMAKKVPMATDALEQAINTACVVLQGKKDGCTIRELREKAKVSAHDLTDAVAGLMLAGKATYTGDRSRTVIMVNKQLERFIIDSLQNNQNYTFDKVQKEAEGAGYSPDEFRDAVERRRVRGSVIIEAHGKIKLPFHPPPAKAVPFLLAPRGSEGERYYEEASPTTYQFKNEFVKDHERVLYSSAFRRLAGVTQVFGTSQGHVFHNRLTHSIKAGQIARSIADRLKPYARADIQFDPDVVEAAALAHDLGHPPFGHTGELELDSLLTKNGVLDGYEGNAQNLRIVTQFSRVRREFGGLNLTRAT
jgi:hypothetical protein